MKKEKNQKGTSTAKRVQQYIKDHPYIKHCLKNGLLNYSALSRKISKELNITNKTSIEAILVAARRYEHSLSKEIDNDKNIKNILAHSEYQIKNKIVVYILRKPIDIKLMGQFRKKIEQDTGTIYVIEGVKNYTLITQEMYSELVKQKFKNIIVHKNTNQVLISFTSSKNIENVPGCVAFLTSLFAENGVNITECLSCWTDTLFVIHADDVSRAIGFLTL